LSYPSRLLLVRCLLVSNNSLFLGLYAWSSFSINVT
jgi:hypothetical protein